MPESFDPYRVWLSIPPESRPPTHYQLLGVSPDEHDPTVINAAVMRQSAYVRNFQVGKYAEQAAQILNEVQAAKACLLDPAKRARYDAELSGRHPAALHRRTRETAPPSPLPLVPALDIDLLAAAETQPPRYGAAGAHRRSKPMSLRRPKRSGQPLAAWLAAATMCVGVLVVIAAVVLWPRHDDRALTADTSEPVVASGAVDAVAEPVAAADTLKAPVETPPPPLAVAPFSADEARQHQERWASYLGRQVEETNSIGMKLVLIPPGEFDAGTPNEERESLRAYANPEFPWIAASLDHEMHRHVVIANPFLVSAHEVTVGSFRRFVEATNYKTIAERDGGGGGVRSNGEVVGRDPAFTWQNIGRQPVKDDLPVANIALPDAQAFCDWLTKQEGRNYRLPKDDEWEFACRAGTTTLTSFGDLDPREFMWFGKNNMEEELHAIGQKRPNAFGLFDMLGNVAEISIDPSFPDNTQMRGGQLGNLEFETRSAFIVLVPAHDRNFVYGFRVLCELQSNSDSRFAADEAARTAIDARSPASRDRTKDWSYGYGTFDPRANRVTEFTHLPYFNGSAWQGSDNLPDGRLGFASLAAGGGHPDNRHMVIRRWISPADGVVLVSGTLTHQPRKGDGICGRVVSGAGGMKGEWFVHSGFTRTDVAAFSIALGETVDFVADSLESDLCDSFEWPVTLELKNQIGETVGGPQSQSQPAGGVFSKKTSSGVRKPRHARGRLLSSFSTRRTS